MIRTEPVTIEDYNDLINNLSKCSVCGSIMKEDTMSDYGYKYKIMVCINRKCNHWE